MSRGAAVTAAAPSAPVQGARYVFTHNIATGIGAVRNAACVGRAIELHPDEPADDPAEPFHLLRHAPIAVWVEPLEAPAPLGDACGAAGPPNCIPMVLEHARSDKAIKLPDGDQPVVHGERVTAVHCTRHGFQLGDGFAVTDYYAEGLSFGNDTWFAHLCRPHTGKLQRASVLVTLTRFADWDRVLAWTPLWPANATRQERERVIKAFHKAAKPPADLTAEMARLRGLANDTRAK